MTMLSNESRNRTVAFGRGSAKRPFGSMDTDSDFPISHELSAALFPQDDATVCTLGDARISVHRWSVLRSPESASDVANSPLRTARIRIGETPAKENVSAFIIRLSVLQNRNEEAANDFVFVEIDRLIDGRAFRDIEDILTAINVRKHKTSVLLSLLSITAYPAIRSRVTRGRRSFMERIREHLMAVEGDVSNVRKLLYGLE